MSAISLQRLDVELLVVLLVIAIIAVGAYFGARRNSWMKDADRWECLLCGGTDLDPPDAADHRCNRCGYDSRRRHDVDGRRLLEHFRDLRHAKQAFNASLEALTRAAAVHRKVIRNTQEFEDFDDTQAILDEADQRLLEAMGYLRDLLPDYPGLLDGLHPTDIDHIDAQIEAYREKSRTLAELQTELATRLRRKMTPEAGP